MACIAAARDRAAACHTKLRRSHGWIMLTRIRHGHEIRLVIPGPDSASIQQRGPKLIALVAEAIAIRDAVLARPDAAFSVIATALGKCRKRMAQLMPIAWLAPDIVEAIVAGTQPADLTHRRLKSAARGRDATGAVMALAFVPEAGPPGLAVWPCVLKPQRWTIEVCFCRPETARENAALLALAEKI